MFGVCLVLSLVALFSPAAWGLGIASALRQSVLAPLVWLQVRAEEDKTSRVRLRALTTERDSAAYRAQGLPSLLAENERLRQLLGLTRRLGSHYVAAEVLHQPQATDGRTLLLSVGSREGVAAFDPVVAPEGLIGVVLNAASRSSIVMTWAHPEFRVSAFTVTGNAAGVVAPSPSGSGEGALEFRGVPYRDSVPVGTLVLSSGLGGVYPKGIPVGTVTGIVSEQAGWERVYRLLPAANPGSAGHVLVLTSPTGDVARAFPSDSALEAQRQDSLERIRIADSVAQAARDARAQRAESLAAIRRDTARVRPRVARPDSATAVRPSAASGAQTGAGAPARPTSPQPPTGGAPGQPTPTQPAGGAPPAKPVPGQPGGAPTSRPPAAAPGSPLTTGGAPPAAPAAPKDTAR
ncbi:MAG TPA: rod shape-determining protein MreC [Gemmatimonadales bacterium]|jgi:rod shape-determining protein MreC|nr:rod shape-determining protein MreC [Gemmatimonadales bacterium]